MAQHADSRSASRRSRPPGKPHRRERARQVAPRLQAQGEPVAPVEGEGVVEEHEEALVAGEGEGDHAALDGRGQACARARPRLRRPRAGGSGISGSRAGSHGVDTETMSTGVPAGSSTTRAGPDEPRAGLGQHGGDGEPLARGGGGDAALQPGAHQLIEVRGQRRRPVRSSGGARSTGRPAATRTISAATASARRPSDAPGVAAAARRRTAASARTAQG